MKRRLTTILAADVVGYSRLMGTDEAGTLAALKAYRAELIEPKAAQYNGRTIKLMGDGTLMEFPSVVEAVTFAVEAQLAMRERNRNVPGDRQIHYRVGINVGDIIVEGEDIYGDGVNIASRLENLAEPGGVCVHRNVRDQVRDRLDLTFEDQGEVEVKNIARPVRAFRVVLDDKAERLVTPIVALPQQQARRPAVIAAAVALVLLFGALAWWQPWVFHIAPASVEGMALPLPDKPSIAVLPFTNMSGDQEQEYFADGLTDDLITDLSKLSGLFVIARNSTFTYKGRPVEIQDVAEEMGVRYVVVGSVRRSGDEVRINAQLIDALSGHHVWAERYDGTLADVFDLQDEVIARIVSALAVSLTNTEIAQAGQADTDVPEAYDAFLQGLELYHNFTPGSHKRATQHFERAIALDPNYARAHAGLAAVYWSAIEIGWEVPMELELPWQEIFDRARAHLAKALEDPSPLAYRVSARLLLHHKRFDEAVSEIDQAIALDPNDADSQIAKSEILVRAGEPEAAEAAARQAMRLNPHYRAGYLRALGRSLFHQERFGEAADVLERAASREPDSHFLYEHLAATYGHLGRIEDAEAAVERYNRLSEQIGWGPLTLGYVGRWITLKEAADLERLRAGLRKAGVPEGAAPLDEEEEFLTLVSENASSFDVAGATEIDVATAKALFDRGATFVDVRNFGAYQEGHIPGSVHLDLYTGLSEERLAEFVAKDEEVVFYCFGASCYRSAHACAKALNWGFTRVYYFAGGLPAWRAAGYSVAAG